MENLLKNDDISDGYHTFGQLYYQRAVLFAVICNQNLDRSWKSRKHEDGQMIPGMFIVGIITPEGQYNYHFELKYWDIFRCKEVPNAPYWDGHTEKEVTRLFSI